MTKILICKSDPRTRSGSVGGWSCNEIEARKYDLKAVNPYAKADQDLMKPEELLALIKSKGKEVAARLARWRVS